MSSGGALGLPAGELWVAVLLVVVLLALMAGLLVLRGRRVRSRRQP
jgi:hypothetical protein